MIVVRKGQAPHSNSSRARLAPDFSQCYRLKSGADHLWIHPEMKKSGYNGHGAKGGNIIGRMLNYAYKITFIIRKYGGFSKIKSRRTRTSEL